MIDINMLSDRFSVRRLNDSNADDILDFCRKNTLYDQYCGADASHWRVGSDYFDHFEKSPCVRYCLLRSVML